MIADDTSPETETRPNFGMTELEEALRGPEGKQIRQSAIARIDDLMRKVDDHLSIGVDPRRIESINDLKKSLIAARNIVISAP